jgi:hypothetical protein
MLSPGGQRDDALETLLAVILDEAKAEIRRGVQAGAIDPASKSFEGGLYLGRIWMRLSPARAKEFAERVQALAEEFEAGLDPGSSATHEFLVGFYPTTGGGPAGEDGEGGD